MASLPARQPSQRRASPGQEPAAASTSPVRARSAHSEDSQTVILSGPTKETTELNQPHDKQQAESEADSDVKKCWICFADSTEDTPETSAWREPCPCALVAHEECLLDWIADLEAPNANRSRTIGRPKIECPQCKAEIKLSRPRDLLVDGVRVLEQLGMSLITPGALTVLLGTVYEGSMAWGVSSVYAIFGAEDGFRILRPLISSFVRPPMGLDLRSPRGLATSLFAIFVDRLVHWRLYVGLPLIMPTLILSRTAIADSVMHVLPVVFFATQNTSTLEHFDFKQWPPSASLAFCVLPFLRSVYNMYWDVVWAEREKHWIKAIKPRSTQNAADGANGDNAADAQNPNGANVLEIRVDGAIWEDWGADGAEAQQQPPQGAAPNNAGAPGAPQEQQAQGEAADALPNIADNRPQQGQDGAAPPVNGDGGRELYFSATAIASSVLGALAFPTIAGMSGELLKLVLPRVWTTLPMTGRGGAPGAATGLLQNKWARSLVGGILFVLMKDHVMLYVRWKMAQLQQMRSVLDSEEKKKKKRREARMKATT